MYDTSSTIAHADKSQQQQIIKYFTLLLNQKVGHTDDITFNPLSAKTVLFQNGEFHNFYQLVCGHRAMTIDIRKETITSQVKDP